METVTVSFLTKVAATLTSSLLQVVGGKLKKTIFGTDKEQALQQAVRDGLVVLLLTAGAVTKDEKALLADIFREYLGDEDVAHALAGLLRGQVPDFNELRELFAEMEFDAERLPGLDFERGMRAFVGAFMESADASDLLQGTIKTGLLRTQVDLSREMLASIRELLKFLRQAREDSLILSGDALAAKGQGGQSLRFSFHLDAGVGNGNAERQYLRIVRSACDHLDLINFDESNPGEQDNLKISQVFTGLHLQNLSHGPKDDLDAIIRQQRNRNALTHSAEDLQPVSAIQAVSAMDRLVVLGRPGSGKSTLVNHLATQLAGQRSSLKDPEVIDGWTAGPLLPVRIVLRKFAAWSGLAGPGNAGMVWHYLEVMLDEMGCPKAFPVIKKILEEEGGIVFFDGLDEVPESVDYHKRSSMVEAIRAFSEPLGKCKIIITCREYAYNNNAEWRLPEVEFPVVRLADFNDKQIEAFAGAWYRAVGPLKLWSDGRCADEAASLIKALRNQDHLRKLAGSPLLLTIMAQLHGRDGSLPRDRAELYKRAVLALLALWENRIVRDREGVRKIKPGLVVQLGVKVDQLQKVLARVAYQVHARQQREPGAKDDQVADISRHELLDALDEELRDLNKANEVVEYIEQRAGLLVAKGERIYSFPHRTFQEYLAAVHILSQGDYDTLLRDLVKGAPDWWREVFLLAASAGCEKTPRVVSDLVDALLPNGPGGNGIGPAQHPIICLAGLALAETDSAARVADELAQIPEGGRYAATHHRLQAWLEKTMFAAAELPIGARAEAGRVLGWVGDPRPGVGLRSDGVPDMVWCEVAAGPFLMGSKAKDAKYEDEREQFSCSLIKKPYLISRYPVTVAQYRAFVKAGGYADPRFWTGAGSLWLEKLDILGPETNDDRFQIDNHPQVGVSWFEAMAFCNWLSEKTGESIGLPTEVQWERAALSTDGRLYPWGGDELDPSRHANISETELRTTSAVGLFPAGNAKCGAADCGGNVWEWCRTVWRADYTDYEKMIDDDLAGKAPRVVRGGSWNFDREDARCAYHIWFPPNSRLYNVGFRCARAVK
jgi:formylglycine-generating enzyme required for sulfatase activity